MSVFLGAASFASGEGGIARVARLSGLALHGMGHSVSGLSLSSSAPMPFPVHSAWNTKAAFLLRTQPATARASLCLYDSAGIARAHPRWAGPFVVWMHGVEAWESARPAALAVFRRAGRVLVNSRHTLARFERCHGPLPAARVCLLATEEDWAPPPRLGPPTALILGRIDRNENYKGHDALIAAWPAVLARVPQARLVIAGGGSGLDAIRRLAAASPASRAIAVRSHVPEAAMESLWAEAGLLAMPSRGEGFGLVYAEAMRHGLPVIASTHDAGAEVNASGETGFTVDLDEPGTLVDALAALLGEPALRKRMGENAQARWRAMFSFERFRHRFEAALGEQGAGHGLLPAAQQEAAAGRR